MFCGGVESLIAYVSVDMCSVSIYVLHHNGISVYNSALLFLFSLLHHSLKLFAHFFASLDKGLILRYNQFYHGFEISVVK